MDNEKAEELHDYLRDINVLGKHEVWVDRLTDEVSIVMFSYDGILYCLLPTSCRGDGD